MGLEVLGEIDCFEENGVGWVWFFVCEMCGLECVVDVYVSGELVVGVGVVFGEVDGWGDGGVFYVE